MKKIVVVSALFLGISTFAQTKQDKIKELISLNGTFTISKEVKKDFISEYKKRYSHVPDLAWKPIEEKINIDELVDKVVDMYGNKFNEKEIDQLLIFYKSDVGKKVIQNAPTMIAEIQDVTRNWAIKINQTINDDLEKMGYLQSPPPPMPSSK
ncbi:DUF2059 domain-containing protein [Chryseobacterium paludis]|uniref:DUF2059 domain-containing protein n=1 Tax=Chryseobacterium paludis TaxID=2956784 RepID=UPI0021C01944|nr:DUF2059 domain-containing protein [Chryseobacterium paludis]